MTTLARRTRLLRAPDLAGYRAHLIDLVRTLDPDTAAGTFVLVPTRAAAAQLARTLGTHLPGAAMPLIGSRAELYDALLSRLGDDAPARYSDFEREAMLGAAAREAEDAGYPAPFHVRPALVAEMLALYDHVRRLGRSVDDFDRLLSGELEPAAESDRGALQLLEQTRFLCEAFRLYETRVAEGRRVDEHALRSRLVDTTVPHPLQHLVVAVGDRPFDADGYWPADVLLFTTLPALQRLDLLATDGVLAAGYLDRVRLAFVEIEEGASSAPSAPPTLVVPAVERDRPARVEWAYRDREDELEAVARRVVAERGAGPVDAVGRDNIGHDNIGLDNIGLDSIGLVVARPLPYLYLVGEVFDGAGLPFEASATLPLAAEPYAAAVDVVLECAAANFTRRALMALLRSPHFRFETGGAPLDRAAIAALDRAMAAERYLGGLDRLASLAATLTGAAHAAAAVALSVARELAPLAEPRPLADQVALLQQFLDGHNQEHDDRRSRARGAVTATLNGLLAACRRHDPSATGTVAELTGAVRRWIGAQTFAIDPPQPRGIRIVDAQSARFAELDDVQVMGLIEGEWPERPRRNVFYPRGLLAQLEPSRPERVEIDAERDQVRSARAMFRDLVGLARRRTRLSTFALEADAVVEPSPFIDDIPAFGFATATAADARIRAFRYEQLIDDPLAAGSAWAATRGRNGDRAASRFEGHAGAWTLPRVSVSRLERYMKCPFQFYVANVLQVPEEPEDENTRSPLDRGRFLHELFETFFHEWQARGRGRITSREMAEARALFEEIAEPALRSLSPAEAGLERARLFGSAVGSGIADRVFAMEAERGVEIRQRLMEYELDDEFVFAGEDGSTRAVRLRAKIDRVDVLGDGSFRLIDYKTKYVPDRRTALQLPIYSRCVAQTLSAEHERPIVASEAMYLSFEGPQAVMPLEERGKSFDELTDAASHRLVATLNDIARGYYPPRPETKTLCTMCRFTAVCRNVGGLPDENTEIETESTESGGV